MNTKQMSMDAKWAVERVTKPAEWEQAPPVERELLSIDQINWIKDATRNFKKEKKLSDENHKEVWLGLNSSNPSVQLASLRFFNDFEASLWSDQVCLSMAESAQVSENAKIRSAMRTMLAKVSLQNKPEEVRWAIERALESGL